MRAISSVLITLVVVVISVALAIPIGMRGTLVAPSQRRPWSVRMRVAR